MFKQLFLPGLVSCCVVPHIAIADEGAISTSVLATRPAQLRLTYENVKISSTENMGLGGLNYLVNISPSFYAGLSAYGAVAGQRGGFFTGGMTLGAGKRLDQNLFDVGMFIGGGGGGNAPQGGGLMLRPHAQISHQFQDFSLGVGVSWVKFPNGGIDSKEAYICLGFSLEEVYADSDFAGKRLVSAETASFGLRSNRSHIVATAERYSPKQGTRTTSGSAMGYLDTLGFEYRYDFSSSWFGNFQVAGARGGNSDGYAEALFGVGLKVPIFDSRTQLNFRAAIGGAGGGSVDTGGGVIGKAGVLLEHQFSPRLSAGIGVGKVISQGDFKANNLSLNLSYTLGELTLGKHGQNIKPNEEVILQGWEITASHQSYLQAQRKTGGDEGINLVGMKLSRQINQYAYLTGQAYGAYGGGAGGYAVGLMGAGWRYSLGNSPWSVSLEALLGVGGGGGLDVAGGGLGQVQAGVRYRLTKNVGLEMDLGKIVSFSGALDSRVVNLNLVYSFTRPELRQLPME